MTGRDLIVYILSNNLEDEDIFKDNKFVGFITAGEAAERLDVGVATIYALVKEDRIESVTIGDTLYIPVNFTVLKN